MKKVLDLISQEVMNAFESCGYDASYGRVGISNRPDLCEFQCNGAMAGAMAGAYSGVEAVPADWRNTIRKVNHVDLESYASKLIALIPEWEVAK